MIKQYSEIDCQIGYGMTRLSVGWVHNVLCIDIEPLLEKHPIGKAENMDCYPLKRCRLLIHNEEGFKQLEKIVKVAGRELRKNMKIILDETDANLMLEVLNTAAARFHAREGQALDTGAEGQAFYYKIRRCFCEDLIEQMIPKIGRVEK